MKLDTTENGFLRPWIPKLIRYLILAILVVYSEQISNFYTAYEPCTYAYYN